MAGPRWELAAPDRFDPQKLIPVGDFAERTRDGIAAAREKGKVPGRRPLDPEKIAAAIKLVEAKLSPTVAAKQLGLGRSTVYREMALTTVNR